MKLTIVAGARPNFVKIAPIVHTIQKRINDGADLSYRIVHTGQHYDDVMSARFFTELNIPLPDINLNSNHGSQAEQTASIMIAFEKELIENRPDLVIVVGDVNSTMACAITAKKLNIKVAHIEAGLRSYDLTMPEEINRMVTDSISDYFFTTSQLATDYLLKTGHSKEQVYFVGNIMTETLLKNQSRLNPPKVYEELSLQNKPYIVLTMHRPSNVDEQNKLSDTLELISSSIKKHLIIFPVHPRTQKNMNLSQEFSNIKFISPLSYLEFNFLVKNSNGVITDSGGITEEATMFKVPCITLRTSTERPETVTYGTNVIVGNDIEKFKQEIDKMVNNNWKESSIPEKWDDKVSERIITILENIL